MTNEARLKLEMSVVRAAIKAALARNLVVSIYDGGEWCLKKSGDLSKVIAAMRSTDDDQVVFRDAYGVRKGWMHFVYGNMPYEVICDYTDNETCEAIYREAEQVADRIEARC